MTDQRTIEQRAPLRCRIFGHRWKAAHRKDTDSYGLPIWVYTDHVCTKCWRTEWLMPPPILGNYDNIQVVLGKVLAP